MRAQPDGFRDHLLNRSDTVSSMHTYRTTEASRIPGATSTQQLLHQAPSHLTTITHRARAALLSTQPPAHTDEPTRTKPTLSSQRRSPCDSRAQWLGRQYFASTSPVLRWYVADTPPVLRKYFAILRPVRKMQLPKGGLYILAGLGFGVCTKPISRTRVQSPTAPGSPELEARREYAYPPNTCAKSGRQRARS